MTDYSDVYINVNKFKIKKIFSEELYGKTFLQTSVVENTKTSIVDTEIYINLLEYCSIFELYGYCCYDNSLNYDIRSFFKGTLYFLLLMKMKVMLYIKNYLIHLE